MGLIKAALGAAGGVMADQWKEYFYCESIPENVMAVKGLHRVSGRSSNYKGSENIISSLLNDSWNRRFRRHCPRSCFPCWQDQSSSRPSV